MSDSFNTLARHVPAKVVSWAAIAFVASFATLIAMVLAAVILKFDFDIAGLKFGRKDQPELVTALKQEILSDRDAIAKLKGEDGGTPEAPSAESIRDAFLTDDEALAAIRGPMGKDGTAASVEEVVSSLLANHSDNLRGPEGPPGAAGGTVTVREVAAALAENHADALRGPTGDPAAFPSGLVMASTKACVDLPGKWDQYDAAEGRFILGVGKGPLKSEVFFEQPGGEETVKLEVPEMPEHRHGTGFFFSTFESSRKRGLPSGSDGRPIYSNQIPNNQVGQGQPHNNMPPYIALHFCKKEG